ncbi:MAG TPA: hypothetical protein VNN19_12095 [bacterium]|nr:hypothetical protein [bacterium]
METPGSLKRSVRGLNKERLGNRVLYFFSPSLTALGVVGIGVFPVVGNALALALGIPRRLAQLVVLALAIAILLPRSRQVFQVFSMLITRRVRWIVVPVFTLIALPGLIRMRESTSLSTYAAWAAIMGLSWLLLLLVHLLHKSSVLLHKPVHSPNDGAWGKTFGMALVLIIGSLALIAYLYGPDPDNAYMAFRGSTTVAGTTAAILAAIALLLPDGAWRPIGLFFAVYLNFIATSRTGLLLLFILGGIALWTQRHVLMRNLVLVLVCGVLVILLTATNRYFPYASSRPGPEGAHVIYLTERLTDWEGIQHRYTRILRIGRIPAPLFPRRTLSPEPQTRILRIGRIPAPHLPPDVIKRLEESGEGDSRWIIWSGTLAAIAGRPWGNWPMPFADATQIYCGRPPICPYPHNLVLEVGYHFGWLALGIMVSGIALLAFRALRAAGEGDLLVRLSSIVLLGQLGLAQFSGDLRDHGLVLFSAVLWTAFRYSSPSLDLTVPVREKANTALSR